MLTTESELLNLRDVAAIGTAGFRACVDGTPLLEKGALQQFVWVARRFSGQGPRLPT